MKKSTVVLVMLYICISIKPIIANDWSRGADINNDRRVDNFDLASLAQYWLSSDQYPDITWIYINDPGIGQGHEGFNGQMSKYETTNAQYCQFLNAALQTGDIFVSGNVVKGSAGSNSGADFPGEYYYQLNGPGPSQDGAVNGGAARINFLGNMFSVDSGFENHPVTYVSWFGATAFCNYYGWQLPTEWQWQAVADFDGSYIYGCGYTINNSIVNYLGTYHPNGTFPVGYFGSHGYGLADMAGNVSEWTSSPSTGDSYIRRGGSWFYDSGCSLVSYQGHRSQSGMGNVLGFRVCRTLKVDVPDVNDMTVIQARQALADASLTIGTISKSYIDAVPAGKIISSAPSAGARVNQGSAIDLLISLGKMPADITWVDINDPGIDGHEGFNGQMSKYETTNAQFAKFLNDALASGDIIVSDVNVYGASGSNTGDDFAGKLYYRLDGAASTYNGAIDGGASRINFLGDMFSVDSGFEDHPVTLVSWYGATAFCSYYGYKLPTEWQWQAVADYDGSYIYGCGQTIDNTKANYKNSIHPYGTTPVGAFGTYGYGLADMAGNVTELTRSVTVSGNYISRSGRWYDDSSKCEISFSFSHTPDGCSQYLGFRVCR